MSGADALTERKAAARQAAFARRKAAHAAADGAAEAAARLFLREIPRAAGETIAGYRPIRTELDVTPLLLALHAAGHPLCLPVIVAAGAPLEWRLWRPGDPMERGAFGAEIPSTAATATPSLVIAPLVAFDRQGGRLGYGGGFYDRSLAALAAAGSVRAVGYAYAAQEAPADAPLPLETTDWPLEAVVTEAGIVRPRL